MGLGAQHFIFSNLLLDTNAYIALIEGKSSVKNLLLHPHWHTSFVVELECLSWPQLTYAGEQAYKEALANSTIHPLSSAIKNKTIAIRKQSGVKVKLPDAIVAATALVLDIPVVSNDEHLQKIPDLMVITYD